MAASLHAGELLEPHAAAPLPEPWAVLTALDQAGRAWTSSAPGYTAHALDERRLELRGTFPAGLVRFDLEGRDGAFDVGSLCLRLRFGPGPGPYPADPDAPPTGPWDYINGDFVVPRFGVAVDGALHPEWVWADLPWAEDWEARRARGSFALRFAAGGAHTVALDFTQPRGDDPRLSCASWRAIRIGPDERNRALAERVDLLPECRGAHPRFWLTGTDVARLREELRPGRPRHAWWNRFLAGPSAATPLGCGLRALLLGEAAARAQALRAGDELAAQTHWGQDRPGHMGCDNDIRAGEYLFLLSLLYDWLSAGPEALAAERARRWRAKIERHARLLFRFVLLQRSYLPTGYLQNHFSAVYMGLGAAGLLLAGDAGDALAEEAQTWLNFAVGEFRRRNALWTPDGSGCPLDVSYGLDFHVRFAMAARSACGLDLLDGPFYRALPDYWLHRLMQESGFGGYRGMLWAVTSATGHAALGAHLACEAAARESTTAEELLWGAPACSGPRALPLTRCFEDAGEVYLHSDPEARRERETWLAFHAGVPFGRTQNARLTRYNYAHYTPDQGALVLRHRGRTILGAAGRSYRKLSRLHNVLTFDESGQFGDGFVWMPKPNPAQCGRLERVADAGMATHLSAELAPAYPQVTGLRSYTRRVLFVRDPQAPLVALLDRVTFAPETEVRTLHWHFHAPEAEAAPPQAGARRAFVGEDGLHFELHALAPRVDELHEVCAQTEMVVQYTWQGNFNRHVTWSWPRGKSLEALGVFVLFPRAHPWAVETLKDGWRLCGNQAQVELSLAAHETAELTLRDNRYVWRA